MKHPRHGHSATWLSDKFIVVTGSRVKNKRSATLKCEMYNSEIDLWFDLPDLNIGRHYHSSCSFANRFVYIFGGIDIAANLYTNSIEKYDHGAIYKTMDLI